MIKKLVFLMCFFFLISGVIYASTEKPISCIGIGSNEVFNGDAKPEVNAVKKSSAQKITKATVDKAYGNFPLIFYK